MIDVIVVAKTVFVTVPMVSRVRVKGVGLMETDKVPLANTVVTVLPTAD